MREFARYYCADALVRLGGLDTQQGLHSEGVSAIQDVLQCSREDAIAVFRDLRLRKLIEEESAPDAHQGSRFRWARPAT